MCVVILKKETRITEQHPSPKGHQKLPTHNPCLIIIRNLCDSLSITSDVLQCNQ